VADAAVPFTLAGDPPRTVELGGPDLLTPKQSVNRFEQVLGELIRRRHVPHAAVGASVRAGRHALRVKRPPRRHTVP